jgi:outer membrane immunogenic protein
MGILSDLPTYHMDHTADLKGILGYTANRVLFYGVLGYSTGQVTIEEIDTPFKPTGMSYGLGVDFAATERLIIGIQYLARKRQDDGPGEGGSDIDFDINTLSLRATFRF